MNEQRQQIAIAECCGYHDVKTEYSTAPFGRLIGRRMLGWSLVPYYQHDLNAMREAEMSLSDVPPPATPENPNPKSERTRYREQLCVVCCMNGGPIHATAAQRSEAFLKVKGKWEDSNEQ